MRSTRSIARDASESFEEHASRTLRAVEGLVDDAQAVIDARLAAGEIGGDARFHVVGEVTPEGSARSVYYHVWLRPGSARGAIEITEERPPDEGGEPMTLKARG